MIVERPTYNDFAAQAYIAYTDVVGRFVNGEYDSQEMVRVEDELRRFVGPHLIRLGQDISLFYVTLFLRCGVDYATEHTLHEHEHLDQLVRLGRKYGIDLQGELVVLQLYSTDSPDSQDVLPMVMTNIRDFLGVLDDESLRHIYRELADGVEAETEGDVLYDMVFIPEKERHLQWQRRVKDGSGQQR